MRSRLHQRVEGSRARDRGSGTVEAASDPSGDVVVAYGVGGLDGETMMRIYGDGRVVAQRQSGAGLDNGELALGAGELAEILARLSEYESCRRAPLQGPPMNPYQPPSPGQSPLFPAQVNDARLYRIASDQRMINLVVLAYIALSASATALTEIPNGHILTSIAALLVVLAGVVYAVRMAGALHGTGIAVLCAILLFVPCVGLLVLLVLNSQATRTLRSAGLRVGLLGADLSQLRRP